MPKPSRAGSPLYRRPMRPEGLLTCHVREGESDLWIAGARVLAVPARRHLRCCRRQLKDYIKRQPEFRTSLSPVKPLPRAPLIVRRMAAAARAARVGPMAAVAGAVAECVGERLAKASPEVIVENGGDIYLKSQKTRRIQVYAGTSPLSRKISLEVGPARKGLGICTSSGTVGPSFSWGLADAVVIIAKSSALADAAATLAGNAVKIKSDIPQALALARSVKGVLGILIIKDDQLGIWGRIRLG